MLAGNQAVGVLPAVADLNGDGRIDALDLALLSAYATRGISCLPQFASAGAVSFMAGAAALKVGSNQTSPNPTQYFFYSSEKQLLSETEIKAAGGQPQVAVDYVWFGGMPVAEERLGGSLLYTFTDHLGTPFLQIDSNGILRWRAEYEPFGATYRMRIGNAADERLRFAGQEFDPQTPQREYNIFRWYREDWGRYTQPDPFMSSLNGPVSNPFAYVNDSPENFVDPLGLTCTSNVAAFITKMCSLAKAVNTSSCRCRVTLMNAGYESGWGNPANDNVKDKNWLGLHVKESFPGPKRPARDNPKVYIPKNDTDDQSFKQYCSRCEANKLKFTNYPQYMRDVVKKLGFANPDKPQTQEDRIKNMLNTMKNCKPELDACCGKN